MNFKAISILIYEVVVYNLPCVHYEHRHKIQTFVYFIKLQFVPFSVKGAPPKFYCIIALGILTDLRSLVIFGRVGAKVSDDVC